MDFYYYLVVFKVKNFDKRNVRRYFSAYYSDYSVCYETMHDTIRALQSAGLYVVSYDISKDLFPDSICDDLKRIYVRKPLSDPDSPCSACNAPESCCPFK